MRCIRTTIRSPPSRNEFAELQLGGILQDRQRRTRGAGKSLQAQYAAREFYEATVLGVSVSDRLNSG